MLKFKLRELETMNPENNNPILARVGILRISTHSAHIYIFAQKKILILI